MSEQREIVEPPVTKNLLGESVRKNFNELLERGYCFTVKDLHEYLDGRNMLGLIGLDLPREDWSKVLNVSMVHRDNPNRMQFMYPLEFTVTDTPKRREFQIGNFALDENRQNKGEGVSIIKAMAMVAKDLGFEKIKLSGGPYLKNQHDADGKPLDQNSAPNILDWYQSRFPKVGNLRQRVEQDPAQAFMLVSDILGTSENNILTSVPSKNT